MSRTTLSRLQPASVLPFAVCLLLVVIDVMPLPHGGRIGTSLSLAGVLVWSWCRPDWLSAGAAFLLGLLHDVVAGLPLGMTSLVLILARGAVVALRPSLEPAGPALLGLSCLALMAAAEALRWVIANLWWGRLFPIEPVLAELVVTVLLFPTVLGLSVLVDTRLPGASHASS
ncbi:rod shape-determining protein MreD [Marinivivus vitaminiproducens]|uniref:rod shape-determining protein MreD n=1 Tax=Marinivivus vitaminiproducens TaxID=3035935 RepID=UPI0027AA5E70|nr:rod shape-determining protein MreD [Geminicoccaceae bacterium SCSIO 64248]